MEVKKFRCTCGRYSELVPWDEWRVVGLAAAISRRCPAASCDVEILSSHPPKPHEMPVTVTIRQNVCFHLMGSSLHLTEAKRRICASKTKAIRHSNIDFHLLRFVCDVVAGEISCWIPWVMKVQGWWKYVLRLSAFRQHRLKVTHIVQTKDSKDRFHAACGSK